MKQIKPNEKYGTLGTPAYTSSPWGWFMMIPGLGLYLLLAISSYMKTTMFSSFNPPFLMIWYAWQMSAFAEEKSCYKIIMSTCIQNFPKKDKPKHTPDDGNFHNRKIQRSVRPTSSQASPSQTVTGGPVLGEIQRRGKRCRIIEQGR